MALSRPVVYVSLLGGAAVLFCIDPARSSCFPPCPFRYATGLYCPGCGSLRAVHQLLHGNIQRAMALNSLMVLSLPLLLVLVLRPACGRHTALPWAILVIVITYAICRNVSVYPFSLLAAN